MSGDSQTIRFLRRNIPSFACTPGCHDCCGPVLASSEEAARLPGRPEAAREAALAALSCPYLGPAGCEAYTERPLVCRLFGTTAQLPCPRGNRPAKPTAPEIEAQVMFFIRNRRAVLI